MEYFNCCPSCGSKEIYQCECDDMNCMYCGSLFVFCEDCDWTNHDECPVENDEEN